jgi:hypothetical protein
MREGLLSSATVPQRLSEGLHFVIISPNRKREAALDGRIYRAIDRILKVTTSQECLLILIKSDGSKLLPI